MTQLQADTAAATDAMRDAALEMYEALVALLELCYHGDFKNGVTDSTGSIDEGDAIASERIDRARAALAKATGAT